MPDLKSFGLYKNSGFLSLYPILSTAILGAQNITNPKTIEVAYVPMKTPTHDNID